MRPGDTNNRSTEPINDGRESITGFTTNGDTINHSGVSIIQSGVAYISTGEPIIKSSRSPPELKIKTSH